MADQVSPTLRPEDFPDQPAGGRGMTGLGGRGTTTTTTLRPRPPEPTIRADQFPDQPGGPKQLWKPVIKREATWPETFKSGALRTIPALGGGAMGGTTVWGNIAGGAAGAALGEALAQAYEIDVGIRNEFSLSEGAIQAAAGAIPLLTKFPGSSAGIKKLIGYVTRAAAEGGIVNMAAEVPMHWAQSGRMEAPPIGNVAASGGVGALFGMGFGAGHLGLHKLGVVGGGMDAPEMPPVQDNPLRQTIPTPGGGTPPPLFGGPSPRNIAPYDTTPTIKPPWKPILENQPIPQIEGPGQMNLPIGPMIRQEILPFGEQVRPGSRERTDAGAVQHIRGPEPYLPYQELRQPSLFGEPGEQLSLPMDIQGLRRQQQPDPNVRDVLPPGEPYGPYTDTGPGTQRDLFPSEPYIQGSLPVRGTEPVTHPFPLPIRPGFRPPVNPPTPTPAVVPPATQPIVPPETGLSKIELTTPQTPIQPPIVPEAPPVVPTPVPEVQAPVVPPPPRTTRERAGAGAERPGTVMLKPGDPIPLNPKHPKFNSQVKRLTEMGWTHRETLPDGIEMWYPPDAPGGPTGGNQGGGGTPMGGGGTGLFGRGGGNMPGQFFAPPDSAGGRRPPRYEVYITGESEFHVVDNTTDRVVLQTDDPVEARAFADFHNDPTGTSKIPPGAIVEPGAPTTVEGLRGQQIQQIQNSHNLDDLQRMYDYWDERRILAQNADNPQGMKTASDMMDLIIARRDQVIQEREDLLRGDGVRRVENVIFYLKEKLRQPLTNDDPDINALMAEAEDLIWNERDPETMLDNARQFENELRVAGTDDESEIFGSLFDTARDKYQQHTGLSYFNPDQPTPIYDEDLGMPPAPKLSDHFDEAVAELNDMGPDDLNFLKEYRDALLDGFKKAILARDSMEVDAHGQLLNILNDKIDAIEGPKYPNAIPGSPEWWYNQEAEYRKAGNHKAADEAHWYAENVKNNIPDTPGPEAQVNDRLTGGMGNLTDEQLKYLDSFDDYGHPISGKAPPPPEGFDPIAPYVPEEIHAQNQLENISNAGLPDQGISSLFGKFRSGMDPMFMTPDTPGSMPGRRGSGQMALPMDLPKLEKRPVETFADFTEKTYPEPDWEVPEHQLMFPAEMIRRIEMLPDAGDNWRGTRFLTPDGKRVLGNDMHEFLADKMGFKLGDALRAGVIRVGVGFDGIETASPITLRQAEIIADSMIYTGKKEVSVDLTGRTNGMAYLFIKEGTKPRAIMAQINARYAPPSEGGGGGGWEISPRKGQFFAPPDSEGGGRRPSWIDRPPRRDIHGDEEVPELAYQPDEGVMTQRELNETFLPAAEGGAERLIGDRLTREGIDAETTRQPEGWMNSITLSYPDLVPEARAIYNELDSNQIVQNLRHYTELQAEAQRKYYNAQNDFYRQTSTELDADLVKELGIESAKATMLRDLAQAKYERASFNQVQGGLESNDIGSLLSLDKRGRFLAPPDSQGGPPRPPEEPPIDPTQFSEGHEPFPLSEGFSKRWGWGQGTRRHRETPDLPAGTLDDALGLFKNLLTFGDYSFIMRQGPPLMFSPHFRRALLKMVKGGWDEDTAVAFDNEIRQSKIHAKPWNPDIGDFEKSIAEKAGWRLKDWRSTRPNRRQEQFISNWVENGRFLGGDNALSRLWANNVGRLVRGSNRAFTTIYNYITTHQIETLFEQAKNMAVVAHDTGEARPNIFKQKYTPEEAVNLNPYENINLARDIIDTVRTLAGDAPLKTHVLPHQDFEVNMERYARGLSRVFLAPRLATRYTRMLNPSTYVMAPPFIRKQYLKGALSVGAFWVTMANLMKLAGAEVNWDPDSADYGVAKWPNGRRLDYSAGFKPFIVMAHRIWSGGFTPSTGGEWQKYGSGFQAQTQLDQRYRAVIENKLDPLVKFWMDLQNASTYRPFQVMDRTLQMAIMLSLQDFWQIRGGDPKQLWMMLPILLGAGTSQYDQGDTPPRFIPEEYDWTITGGGLKDRLGEIGGFLNPFD